MICRGSWHQRVGMHTLRCQRCMHRAEDELVAMLFWWRTGHLTVLQMATSWLRASAQSWMSHRRPVRAWPQTLAAMCPFRSRATASTLCPWLHRCAHNDVAMLGSGTSLASHTDGLIMRTLSAALVIAVCMRHDSRTR